MNQDHVNDLRREVEDSFAALKTNTEGHCEEVHDAIRYAEARVHQAVAHFEDRHASREILALCRDMKARIERMIGHLDGGKGK